MCEKCCFNCMHWEKTQTHFNPREEMWEAPCLCPDKPPSTSNTLSMDYCKYHEEDENVEII